MSGPAWAAGAADAFPGAGVAGGGAVPCWASERTVAAYTNIPIPAVRNLFMRSSEGIVVLGSRFAASWRDRSSPPAELESQPRQGLRRAASGTARSARPDPPARSRQTGRAVTLQAGRQSPIP